MATAWERRPPSSWAHSFAVLRPQYENFGHALESLLRRFLEAEAIPYELVQSRVKTVPSFRDKLVRKPERYRNPLWDMPDTVGVRVVVHFRSDVERLRGLIERELAVFEQETRRPGEGDDPQRFGYSSLHLVVRVGDDRLQLPEWAAFAGMRAELQIRTLLEHTWAAIDHRLRYKRDEEWAPEVRRRNALIAAQLEAVDADFDALRQDVLATEPTRPPSVTVAMLDEFELGRQLDSSGIRDRWWAIALDEGLVPGRLLEGSSPETWTGYSLLWLRLLASVGGIASVGALIGALERIGDDGARVILRRVVHAATELDESQPPSHVDPYDPISIVLHIDLRLTPFTLIDLAQFSSPHEKIGDFCQGWMDGHLVEAIESIMERR